MIFDEEQNEIVFETTGRREYVFSGILGIGASYHGDKQAVSYGSDGDVYTDEMTQAEREELADYAIAKWRAFRQEKSTGSQS